MADQTFLTTEELLEYLQVNLRTIYRLIKAGKIPAVRVGRQWRFNKRDIDAWLASQRSSAGPLDADAGRGDRRSHVLVADDDASVRKLVAQLLEGRGYVVDQAGDGSSALERLKVQNYDLLIVDLKMPDIDGLTVARIARQAARRLPVIIITGHSTEERAVEAANLGVSGYLLKPFGAEQVVGAVDRALAKTA